MHLRLTEYPSGWTCAEISLRLERHVDRTLSREESLAVAEHVEACAWCAQVLEALRAALAR